MNIIRYLPFIILAYFSLDFLQRFIDENIISLKDSLELSKIEHGMVSINDLQGDNYIRFLKIVHLYLSTHGYDNIIVSSDGTSKLTSMEGILNGEKVYINCIQNEKSSSNTDNNTDDWVDTNKSDLKRFLARMIQSNCNKGLLINNSTFSVDGSNFVQSFNSQNIEVQIILVDGYELTRAIRSYKDYSLKGGNTYESK